MLVGLAQAGDRKAMDALVGRHRKRVEGVIRRFGFDEDEAQDLAQETFIKASAAIRKFNGDAAFTSWLHKIAIRVAIDSRRKRLKSAGPSAWRKIAQQTGWHWIQCWPRKI